MKKARYVRTSTKDQKNERQLIKTHKDEILFIDVCSGSLPFAKRKQGELLIDAIKNKEIDYINVHAIDRLGRNLIDILNTLQFCNDNNVCIKVDNLGIESLVENKPNQVFKLIISVLGNVAEMERDNMKERQQEGIRIAKAKGTYKGRVRGSKEDREAVLNKYQNVIKHLKSKQSLRNTAKLCDVSLGTVQKVKSLLEVNNN